MGASSSKTNFPHFLVFISNKPTNCAVGVKLITGRFVISYIGYDNETVMFEFKENTPKEDIWNYMKEIIEKMLSDFQKVLIRCNFYYQDKPKEFSDIKDLQVYVTCSHATR